MSSPRRDTVAHFRLGCSGGDGIDTAPSPTALSTEDDPVLVRHRRLK